MYGTIDTLWLIEAIVSILMKVLRWSRTISHLFLRICCIVDDIVHFIWMRGCINNYPHPVCGIDRYQFKKKTHLYMIALFSIHFIHLSTSFFFQSQNSVYIFLLISPSRSLCPWPTLGKKTWWNQREGVPSPISRWRSVALPVNHRCYSTLHWR